MESEQAGGISAAAPVFSAKLSESSTIPLTTDITSQAGPKPRRTKSLKRSRSDQHNPTNFNSIAGAGLVGSPSPKSPRFKGAFSSTILPAPITGAAALEEQRRSREENRRAPVVVMSENPRHKVLSSLTAGGGAGMSKLQDAPVSTATMSEGMSAAANAISLSSSVQYEDKAATSPASVTSLASLSSSAQTATASSTFVASPAAMAVSMDTETRVSRLGHAGHLQPQSGEQSSNRALSFPGNVLGQSDPSRIPPRGMSLPMPGQQLAPRSISQKKHKCPYCETEFTRHHNLKSHLLTHSQEKPYVCQTCTMRFRRLHDLKRHMKLHTGERPHVCAKCDRKFARGDALARHSKGQGGCAGRRSSMGSFGADDDYEGSNAGDGEEGMDGVMYTNGTPHPNEGEMTEEDRRRFSLPSIKAQHVSGNSGSGDNYAPQSRGPSTYPPAGQRPGQPTGGLYPPNTSRGGTSSSGTSPSMQNSVGGPTSHTNISSMPLSTGASMFSQNGGMTESPKSLSPSAMQSHQLGHDPGSINRQRSPSLTTQFQQQHFGRRPSVRASPPGMSLPSPHNTSHGPKLPPLPALAPPDQRYTLPSQTPGQQNSANDSHSAQQGQPMSGGTSPGGIYHSGQDPGRGATSAVHHQSSGSGDSRNNLFASGEQGVWTYVQTLEDKLKQMSEKIQFMEGKGRSQDDTIKRLREELFSSRNQHNNQGQPQHAATPGHS